MDSNGTRQHEGVNPLLTPLEIAAYCRVDSARVDKPLRFIAQVEKPYGVYLHWGAKVSQVCLRNFDASALCPLCADAKMKIGWYALILGRCWNTLDTILALLPEVSYLRAAKSFNAGSLHGRMITYTRKHAFSTVVVQISTHNNTMPLPLFDVPAQREIIERAYERMASKKRRDKAE